MLATRVDSVRLGQLLEERGLSPRELAERAGVAKETVYSYLSGRRGYRPSYEVLARIARVLGVSAEDLFFLPENATNVVNMEDDDAVASH